MESETAAPDCPACGSSMVRRTARRGSRAGLDFWGCSTYPNCREIVEIEGDSQLVGSPVQDPAGSDSDASRLISWEDGTLDRPGYVCSYVNAGASVRAAGLPSASWQPLAQAWMARPMGNRPSENVARVVGLTRKLIQRGTAPPLDPEAERALLDLAGLQPASVQSSLPGDLSLRLEKTLEAHDITDQIPLEASDFAPDPDLALDSDEERQFLDDWIPRNLGATAGRWFTPQAPLDLLLAAHGRSDDDEGARRIDFLVTAPWLEPFAVEIDGEQHLDAEAIDDARDDALGELGIDVIRVTTAELRRGAGPNLDAIKRRYTQPDAPLLDGAAMLVWGSVATHRAALAVLQGIEAGLVDGDEWRIGVDDPLDVISETLPPYLTLLIAVDELWGAGTVPRRIILSTNGDAEILEWDESLRLHRTPADQPAVGSDSFQREPRG